MIFHIFYRSNKFTNPLARNLLNRLLTLALTVISAAQDNQPQPPSSSMKVGIMLFTHELYQRLD